MHLVWPHTHSQSSSITNPTGIMNVSAGSACAMGLVFSPPLPSELIFQCLSNMKSPLESGILPPALAYGVKLLNIESSLTGMLALKIHLIHRTNARNALSVYPIPYVVG